ncbi:MAG TPA: hypothetical protein VFB60_20890 [Ktedonobacteraceae bacterium]|nr:hypothetical protein [Ktedonobacteraceae bacterium]
MQAASLPNHISPPQSKHKTLTIYHRTVCRGDEIDRVQFIAVPPPEIVPTCRRASARPHPPPTSPPCPYASGPT